MTTPHDPFDEDNISREAPPKKPEYIIIEGPHDEPRGGYEGSFQSSEAYGDFLKTQNVKYPFVVRVIAFLAALCALGWMIGCVISGIIFFVLAAVTLFRVASMNRYALRAWSFFKTALVGFISAMIAIFSPSLGLGLFIMYFTLKHEAIENSLFQGIVNNYFGQK